MIVQCMIVIFDKFFVVVYEANIDVFLVNWVKILFIVRVYDLDVGFGFIFFVSLFPFFLFACYFVK